MTTSRFVFSTQKTIDLCYLKLVPDRWQRKLFSERFLWPGITAHSNSSPWPDAKSLRDDLSTGTRDLKHWAENNRLRLNLGKTKTML